MAFRRALLSSVLLLALPVHVVGQQPYHNWAKAYAAAEALVGNWTREELANASGFNGNAPGYVPFTAKDGKETHDLPHPVWLSANTYPLYQGQWV